MTVHLYRGLSNKYEYEMIVQNKTAGGQKKFENYPEDVNDPVKYSKILLKNGAEEPPKFSDLNESSLKKFLPYQIGMGERWSIQTNIQKLRPIIEYTTE